MFSSLNNRELATYIWLTVFLIIVLIIPSLRKDLPGLLQALFVKKIVLAIFLMVSYVSLTIYIMQRVGFWNLSLLKDSIVWLFGVGFIMLMNANKATKDESHFKEIVKETFKLTIIVDFAINLYVLNLALELILLPTITFLVLMQLVSQQEEKHKRVAKFINGLLSIFGLILIIYVIHQCIVDFKNFATLQNLKSFLFPIFLALAYIPFIYLIALYILYEVFFIRIDMAYRHHKLLGKYAKWKTLKVGSFNISSARLLSKKLQIFNIRTRKEFDTAVSELIH